MGSLKSALLFVLQSIVVGLAVAFLVVLVRPDLLPIVGGGTQGVSGYADHLLIRRSLSTRIPIIRTATDGGSRRPPGLVWHWF